MKPKIDLRQLSKKYPQRRAFITGAGSGLGLAFATELARHKWTIGITDVNQGRLDAAATTINAAGGNAKSYLFDVSHFDAFEDAVKDFVQEFGGIDFGINNAGIGCAGSFDELPLDSFRRTIEIDLMGVVHGCYTFVPVMKRQKAGHILNVASAAAFAAGPRMAAYNVAKAGVCSLSETLKAELYEDGIDVSVLMPTFIRTNIGQDCLGTPEKQAMAQILTEQSSLTPESVVREALLKVQENALYIVFPADAQFMWRLKRLVPGYFWNFIRHELKRKERKFAKEIATRQEKKLSAS